MQYNKKRAWHFVATDRKLRHDDGRRVKTGHSYAYSGDISNIVLCLEGMHASYRLVDALAYSPGPVCCRVSVYNVIESEYDKFVCERRRVDWMCDISPVADEIAYRVLRLICSYYSASSAWLSAIDNRDIAALAAIDSLAVSYILNDSATAHAAEVVVKLIHSIRDSDLAKLQTAAAIIADWLPDTLVESVNKVMTSTVVNYRKKKLANHNSRK